MADGTRDWSLEGAHLSLREKSSSRTPLAWVERDQKAESEIGGAQLLGPVHSQCPQPNGPYKEKVRHSLPGARYIPEKKNNQIRQHAESYLLRFGILAITGWQWEKSACLLRCLS